MVYGLRGLPGAGTGFISSASTTICWENVEKLADRRPVAGRGGVARERPPRYVARGFPYGLERMCSDARTTLSGFARELAGAPSRDASARFRRLEPLRPKPATARKAARTAPSRSSPRNPGSLRVGVESFQKMRALFGHARRLWSRRPPPDAARSGAISTAECWKNALTVRLHGREVQHPPCPRSTPVKLDRVERPAAFDFHRGKRSRF